MTQTLIILDKERTTKQLNIYEQIFLKKYKLMIINIPLKLIIML